MPLTSWCPPERASPSACCCRVAGAAAPVGVGRCGAGAARAWMRRRPWAAVASRAPRCVSAPRLHLPGRPRAWIRSSAAARPPPAAACCRQLDEKETTVYKRAMEVSYQLKMKASRELLSEVGKKYPTMLFRCAAAAAGCVWMCVGGCAARAACGCVDVWARCCVGWAGWGWGSCNANSQRRNFAAPRRRGGRPPPHPLFATHHSLASAAPRLSCRPAAPVLPSCSLRGIEAKQARFGLVECLNHGLLSAYPVTYEKEGELVAHVSVCVW